MQTDISYEANRDRALGKPTGQPALDEEPVKRRHGAASEDPRPDYIYCRGAFHYLFTTRALTAAARRRRLPLRAEGFPIRTRLRTACGAPRARLTVITLAILLWDRPQQRQAFFRRSAASVSARSAPRVIGLDRSRLQSGRGGSLSRDLGYGARELAGFPGIRGSSSRWNFWMCDSPQRPSAVLGRATFQQHAVVARSNLARRQFSVHAPAKCSSRTAGGRRGSEPGRSASDRILVPRLV